MFPFPFSFFGAAAEPPELELIDNNFAMEFNGSDEYFSATTSSDLEITGNITISAWVYITTGSAYQGIITKRDSGGTNYQLYTDNSTIPRLRFFDGSTATSSTGTVSLNAWHHVAITVDSGVTNGSVFYIDGAPSGTATFTITSNDADLLLGAIYQGGVGSYFSGDIDEVAIWSRALEAADITTIYNATNDNPGKCANLWSGGLGTGLVYWNRMGD